MSEVSKIEWTRSTFNPWWGCVEVSEACDHCYARELAKRYGQPVWGDDAPRRRMSESYWKEPVKWNRKAKETGEFWPVFCASMADVFETSRSEVIQECRPRLFQLIEDTPHLTWLLLTKRPHNMTRYAPESWRNRWPDNVWALTTLEHQKHIARVERLLEVPAVVRGLSAEPLFSALDLSGMLGPWKVNWVITGGESGPHARPGHPDWYRGLREQCRNAGIAFHFKQWGNHAPERHWSNRLGVKPDKAQITYVHLDGSTKAITKSDLAADKPYDGCFMVRCDKKAAGRILDGRTHNEYPAAPGVPNDRWPERMALA